jgi:hypothetical protein
MTSFFHTFLTSNQEKEVYFEEGEEGEALRELSILGVDPTGTLVVASSSLCFSPSFINVFQAVILLTAKDVIA